jgi:hypothetical protein
MEPVNRPQRYGIVRMKIKFRSLEVEEFRPS